ncbi:MAG: ion channel [Ornithinimicrobium sp.]
MTTFHLTTPVRLFAAVVGVLVAYYFAPVDIRGSTEILNLALTGLSIALLIYIVRVQWLAFADDSTDTGAYGGLALLLILVLVTFALAYFVLEANRPGQFVGLETRTDALYFTMTTLTTTGFGEIHAAARFSRLLVTAQMFFDLVFLAALGTAVNSRIRSHIASKGTDG